MHYANGVETPDRIRLLLGVLFCYNVHMTIFLQNEMEQAGYKTESLANGILIVHDFITEEEENEYFKIINSATEEDWQGWYTNNLKNFCLQKFGRDDVENLVAEGKFEITSNWHDKNLEFIDNPINHKVTKRLQDIIKTSDQKLVCSGFYFIQRMYEGVELVAHTDEYTDPSIKYASIIYIHDDYNGGEIFWPNVDVQIKPKPRDLLLFPGNDEFHHGVRHVLNGPTRYVLPSFIKTPNFYQDKVFTNQKEYLPKEY